MKVKIAFFDIDGTLIPFNKNKFPESAKRSIEKMRKKGIKVYVATGKSLAQLLATKATEIPFDGYLTLNGQLCYDENFKLFFGNPINQNEMEVLERIFDAKAIPFTLIGEFARYINYVNDTVINRQKETNSSIPSIDKYKGEKIYQITAYVTNRQRELLESVLDLCKVTSWAIDAVDIIDKNGGKLNAIKKICEKNNVRIEETIAFGDGENDIEMVRFAGIGVAMGNGKETLKEAADYVTDDIEKDGVEKALKHFEIID